MKGENPFSQLIQLRNARQCLEVHAKSNAKSAGSLIAECIQESRKREALILDSMTRKYGGGSAKTPATPSSSEEFHRVMSLIVDLLVGGQSTATKNNSAMKVLELPIDVVSCQNGVAGMKSYKDPLQGLDTNVKKSDKINLSSHAVDLTSFTLSLIENMGRSVVPATTGSDEVPGFFSWESNLKKALKRAGDAVVEYQNGIARLLDTLSSNGDFPLMGKQGAKPTKEWTELVCLIEDAIIGRQKQLVALLLWSLSNLFHGSGGLAARPLFFLFAVRTKTGIELDMIPSKICDRLIAFVRNDIVSLLVPEASLTKVISVQVESEVKDLRAYVKLDKSVTVIMDDLCYSLNERCKELGVDAAYIKQEFEPMFQVNESNYDQLKKSLFEVKYGAGELERRFAKGTILVRMDSLQKVLLAEISAKSDQKRKALESSTVGGAEPTVTLSRWANLFSSDDKENNLRARFDAFRQSGSKGGRYDTGLNPQMHISRLLEEQRKGIIRPDTSARSVRSQLEQSRNHDREAIQKQIRVTSITKSPRSTMTSQVQDEVEVSPAPSAGKSPRSSLIPPSPQRGVVSPAQSPKRASRPNEEQNKVLTEVLKLYPFLKEQPCPGVFLTDIEFRSNPRFNAAINRLIVKRNTNAVYKRSGLKVSDDASALEGEVNSVLHDIAKELQQTTLEGYKRYPFLDWRIDGVILGLVTLEADEDEQFQTLFKLRNQVIRGASGAADGNKQRLSNTENCLRERARVIASTLMAVNPVKAEVSRIAFRRLQSEEDVSAGSSQNATTPNSSPQPQQQTPDTVSSGKSEITQKNTSQPSAKAATAAPPSKTAVPEPKSAPAIEKPTPAVSAPQVPVSKQPVKQSTQPKQVSPARETKTAAPASEVKPTVAQTDSVKRTKEAPTSQVKEATAEVKPPTTATKKPSAASTQQVEKKDPESSAAKSSAPEKPKSGTSVSKQVTTTASASARVVPTKSEATPEKTACQNRTNGSSFHRSSVLLAMESSGTESTTTLKPSPPPTAPSSCRQEEAREVTDTNRAPGARIASPHIEAPKPAPAKIAAAPKAEPKPTSSALTAKKPVKVAEAKVIKSVPKKKSTDSIPSLPSTPMTTGRGADQAPKHETEGSLFKQFTPGEPQSQYAKAIGAIESDNAQMERMMGQRRSSLQMADLSGTSGVSVSATPPKPVKPPARTVTKTAASKSNSPPGPNNHLESGPMHMSDQFYTGGSQRPSIVKEAGEKDQWAVSQPSPLSSQPRLSDRPQSQPNSGKHLSPTWRSATYSGLEPSKTTSSESLPAMSATQMQSRPQDRDSRSTGAVPRVVPSASSVPRKTSHAKGDAKLQPIRGAVRTQPKLSAPRKGSPKVAPPVSPVTKQPPATTSPTASSRPSRTAYDIMLQRQEELNRSVSSPTGLQAAGKNEYFRTCSPRTQSPSRSPARLGHEPAAPTSPVSFGFNEQVGDRPHLHFPAEASLSEVYLQACEGLGMRPNSGLLRTFPNRHGQYMEKLDLSVNYVGIKGLQPILYVLERNSDHLEHLCLSNNNLENAEVLSLLQVLFGPAGDRLTYLDLSYNPISQLGGQALQRLVNSKPNLGTIKIKGTLIPPKLQQLIVDKVEDNAYRKHIGLA